ALFSFVLVFWVSPMTAVFLANIPLLLSALFLFHHFSRQRLSVYLGAAATLAVLGAGMFLEPLSLVPPEGKLAYYRESRYGRIQVLKDQEQYTLFVGGVPLFSSQNLNMAEETIHYPLSQVDTARNVLLISAQGGMMAELEKYRPASVDYVELDPKVADVEFRFGLIKRIPGLRVIHQDGRAYLEKSKKIYDAIIVNLSEPDTFQINRFYTDRQASSGQEWGAELRHGRIRKLPGGTPAPKTFFIVQYRQRLFQPCAVAARRKNFFPVRFSAHQHRYSETSGSKRDPNAIYQRILLRQCDA
ncbi:MAG: hypothetical protein P8185_25970, partial [Deltaproteobacteria bacterium]